jgi:hypothetical protein
MSNARAHPVLKDTDTRAPRTLPGREMVESHASANALANLAATLAAVEAFVNDVLRQSRTPRRGPLAGHKR